MQLKKLLFPCSAGSFRHASRATSLSEGGYARRVVCRGWRREQAPALQSAGKHRRAVALTFGECCRMFSLCENVTPLGCAHRSAVVAGFTPAERYNAIPTNNAALRFFLAPSVEGAPAQAGEGEWRLRGSISPSTASKSRSPSLLRGRQGCVTFANNAASLSHFYGSSRAR